MGMILFPEVTTAAHSFCGSSWKWHNSKNHRNLLNFWFIRSGSGRWQSQGQAYQLKPGDCFIQRLWKECRGDNTSGRTFEVLWANFRLRTSTGKHINMRSAPLPGVYRYIKTPEFMTELALRMVEAHRNSSGPGTGNGTTLWMKAILEEIAALDQHSASQTKSGPHADAIESICRKILHSPEAVYSVADLAKSAHLTAGHFTRVFNQVKGLSPRAFINQAKANAAKSLLLMSDASVTQIAEELGYNDVYHFSKRFREQTGLAPTAFRKMQ